MADFRYGALITPVCAAGESEQSAIQEFFNHCDTAHQKGYHSVWLTEHHFSTYHPAPDPFAMLSHVAARCPGLGLGTAVLVTPWHHPLRLAGQIAALSNITDAPILLGMGRGNAPMEYDAFGVDMNYAKEIFAECWDILQRAMTGEPFSYKGEHFAIDREVAIHPRPRMDNVIFYGAVGQASSAAAMGEKGLALMTNGVAPLDIQRSVVENWAGAVAGKPELTSLPKVVSPFMIIADTDEEANDLAIVYMTEQMKAQQAHYALDKERNREIRGYEHMRDEEFLKMFRPNEETARAFIGASFIGSPQTVAKKLQELRSVGFDYFLVNTGFPNCPHHLRRLWLNRFVDDVLPLVQDNIAETVLA